MIRKKSITLWAILLVLFGLVLAYFIYNGQNDSENTPPESIQNIVEVEKTTLPSVVKKDNDSVPSYVRSTYEYILEHGDAPPGFYGGKPFQNREKRLPMREQNGQTIKYREWDVHPRRYGVDRGAERLVTGSDKTAWFTKDHYKTFFLFDRK